MWIFEHNFVADKAKIRRRAVARQVFFTQYAAKFAEKTRVSACEDWFLHFGENSGNYSDSITTNFYSCLIAATEYNSNQSSGIFHRQFISVIIPYTDFQNLQVRQLFCNPKSTTRLICGTPFPLRQYRTKSVWRLCTPSACKFFVIFHKNAREYIKYSLRFLFHLTKNLTTHLSHNLCAVLP